MKSFDIKIEPYGLDLFLMYGSDAEFVKTVNKKFGKVDWSEGGYSEADLKKYAGIHTFVSGPPETYLIWIRPTKKNSELFLTISHECLHCTIKAMKYVGVRLSDDSEEAFTYFHEYLTREVSNAIFNKC